MQVGSTIELPAAATITAGASDAPSSGAARRPFSEQAARAVEDVRQGLDQRHFWVALAWNDILQRYRGSMLGPFWLTLTNGLFIACLGPLYAALFKLDAQQYLPFMAVGILVWNFVTGTINDSCKAFLDNSTVMRQMKLPRSTAIFHTLARNVLIFLHSLPIIVLVAWIYKVPVNGWTLLVLPGFALLYLNLVWISLLLAMLSLRYRDVVQIIGSIVMLGFFFTPVMWNPKLQSVNPWIVNLNPFAALLELVRAPVLGEPISPPLLLSAILMLLVGSAVTSVLFVRYRRHIIFWI